MGRRALYVVSSLGLILCIMWQLPAEAQLNAGNDATNASMSVSDVFPFGNLAATIPAA